MIEPRDRDELRSNTSNYQSYLTSLANRALSHGLTHLAGEALVLERQVHLGALGVAIAIDNVLPPEAPQQDKSARSRKAKAAGDHRHKFVDVGGVVKCMVTMKDGQPCHKVKGTGGRPSAAERTVPIPGTEPSNGRPLSAADANKFSGGGMGSSSSTERRR